jgi:hypothetical protein
MVRYNNKKYPQNISCKINEMPGHFDKTEIDQKNRYSLHTEYSYEKRKFNSNLLDDLNEIRLANKNGIPQLWKNKAWAKEFFKFIERLLNNSIEPEIIEIHPPFIDYCNSIHDFLDIYEVFEQLILNKYNCVKIFIENRCGTRYGKKFLISNCNDIINLCEELSTRNLKLQMVLDYPQLLSSEGISICDVKINKIITFNENIKQTINYFGGIHLWGKKHVNNHVAPHNGNLDTLFNNNISQKEIFLKSVYDTFNDSLKRYMVLEVNSNINDLNHIIKDLENYNFKFI